jgi:hypothetical protein
MRSNESLSLPDRFELPHSSLSLPGRFMRLLCPIVLILLSTVDRFRYEFTMCDTITTQFVRHDLPVLTTMTSQQPLEEAFCCDSISSCLQKHINNLTILIDCAPQIMLLTIYLDEHFIDIESITKPSMLSL